MILLNDLKFVIETQVAKYPKMRPQDAVRLVYQHVYGNGEILKDKESSMDFLQKEYDAVKFAHRDENLEIMDFSEDIGNWYARINLLKVKNQEELITLNDTFAATKNFSETMNASNVEYFLSRLYFLRELCQEGIFEFDLDELDEFLEEYEKKGYPVVPHSHRYKEFYDPAYRVIDARYIRLFPLIEKIRKLMSEKSRVIVAFDGMTAAGKTTAAELLSYVFDCSIIHMDDFMLPIELQTKERFAEPGGNIHYERFKEEVVRYIKKDEAFSYRRFDCGIMNYGAKVEITPKKLVIVEGTYSQHIEYRSMYDLKVFFEMDEQSQQMVVYNCYGDEMYSIYNEVWIPMENKYFETSEIKDKSHIIVKFE